MTIYPDRDQRNADWIKTLSWNLPRDPEEFKAFISASGMTLEHFMTLPAAEAMPDDIAKYLGVTVPKR